MQGSGLREVNNPSEVLISKNDDGLSGTAIASTVEGMRPFLSRFKHWLVLLFMAHLNDPLQAIMPNV